MACPDENLIVRHAVGELTGPELAEIEEHVDRCSSCAMLVAAVARKSTPAAFRHTSLTSLGIGSASSGSSPDPVRIGRHVVLGCLGAGGMGRVYAAFDPRLRRQVAVKVIRTELASPEEHERLRREARALAALSHPNVVAVFDVGTIEGAPSTAFYIAMELVDGVTLREWCSQHAADTDEVIEKFVQAGRGLAAAHRAGLVHRDFKPDNAFVGRDGRVRIGDFGLARSAEPRDTPASGSALVLAPDLWTQSGTVAGTRGYMAPEQRAGAQLDARADQFSFCVALWEALTGRRPQAVSSGGHHPSGWERVDARLRGVLSRGLAADPADRWSSMDVLLSQLVRRPRSTLPAIAVGLTAVTLGGAALVWLSEGAPEEAPTVCVSLGNRADRIWTPDRRAELAHLWEGRTSSLGARLDGWVERWRARHDAICADPRDAVHGDDRGLACLSRAIGQLEMAIELALTTDADPSALRRTVEGLPDPDRCTHSDEVDRCGTDLDAELATAVAASREQIARARAARSIGQVDRALPIIEQELAWAHRVGHAPLVVEALVEHGAIAYEQGALETAIDRYEDAYHLAEARNLDDLAGTAASTLALVFTTQLADTVRGRKWVRHAEAALARLPPDRRFEKSAHTAAVHGNLLLAEGDPAGARQKFELALERLEVVYGAEHHEIVMILNDLGNASIDLESYDEAAQYYERGLELARQIHGERHPVVALLLGNAGITWERRQMMEEAAPHFRGALAIYADLHGELHPEVARTAYNVGIVEIALGNSEAARAAFTLAERGWSAALGPDNYKVARVIDYLAGLALEAGEHDEAESLYQRSLVIYEAARGSDHLDCAIALNGLAKVELARGHGDRALPLAERALELRERGGAAPHLIPFTRIVVARALWLVERRPEAVEAAQRARVEGHDAGEAGEESVREAEAFLAAHRLTRGHAARG